MLKDFLKVSLKVLIVIVAFVIIGIVVFYFINCYNKEYILSSSPYDNHNITVKADGCIFVTMPGQGQRSSSAKFRNYRKILFTYKWEEPMKEGDRIDNVLWYHDSACIYIQGSHYMLKETIYYDTYSKKREQISGTKGNKEIRDYFTNKLRGNWVSSIDTMEINDTSVVLKADEKEICDFNISDIKRSPSYFIRYNDMILCRSSKGYIRIIQVSDNELKVKIYKRDKKGKKKSRNVKYKKIK